MRPPSPRNKNRLRVDTPLRLALVVAHALLALRDPKGPQPSCYGPTHLPIAKATSRHDKRTQTDSRDARHSRGFHRATRHECHYRAPRFACIAQKPGPFFAGKVSVALKRPIPSLLKTEVHVALLASREELRPLPPQMRPSACALIQRPARVL